MAVGLIRLRVLCETFVSFVVNRFARGARVQLSHPRGRACPVGLQHTDLIRGHPRLEAAPQTVVGARNKSGHGGGCYRVPERVQARLARVGSGVAGAVMVKTSPAAKTIVPMAVPFLAIEKVAVLVAAAPAVP